MSSVVVGPPERTIGVLGFTFEVGAVAMNAADSLLFGSTQDPGRFVWASSDPSVAAVEETECEPTGRRCQIVTGLSQGTAVITATTAGVEGGMTVEVFDRARAAWAVSTATGAMEAGVAVASDGTIYVGSDDFAADRTTLRALSPSGGEIWALELPQANRSVPAIAPDGTLYLGSRTRSADGSVGALLAVDPSGSVRWRLDGLDWSQSSPSVGANGSIHLATRRHVYAVDPAGESIWTFRAEEEVFFLSSPAVGVDGTVYVGAEDGRLYALGNSGELLWTFRAGDGDRIRSSPAIGADGTIYFSAHDGHLYAVTPEGFERWRVQVDLFRVDSSPSIGPDGTIYVGGGGGTAALSAVDQSGSIRWQYPGSQVTTTPLVGADGTVYVGEPDGLTALDPQGRLLWTYQVDGLQLASPAIASDGAIIGTAYVQGTNQGTIFAVEESNPSGGFSSAPWPKARGDRANSGRSGG